MLAMRSRGTLLVGLAAVALIATAGAAQGAVTIGSNLGSVAMQNDGGCGAPCTTTNLALNTDVAPGGLTSPVNGTVTSWQFKSGSAANTVSLRVLRPGAGVAYTGAGTSAPQTSGVGPINGPFATSLGIQAGDHIGLNASAGALVMSDDVGGTQLFWNMPQLADGSTRDGTVFGANREVMVQATVEPTNTLGISAQPVLNKKKGTATLTISVPNPGQLDFSGTGINIAETAAVKTVTAPGPVKLLIRATGKKRKKLNRKGKVGVTATFTFTPTGGAASTQSKSLKLKKKLNRKK
jgi:hypothetical protein